MDSRQSNRIFSITLNRNKSEAIFPLDSNYPKLGLQDIVFDLKNLGKSSNFKVEYCTKNSRSGSEVKNALFTDSELKANGPDLRLKFPIEDLGFGTEYDQVRIVAEGLLEDQEIRLDFSKFPLSIEFYNLFTDFDNHFQDRRHQRIVFSAPYGSGKTTFLNEYFSNKRNNILIFRLMPINYSIAPNEDIFKYIKCELLWQLLQYDLEFDEDSFGYDYSVLPFISENVFGVLSVMADIIPYIGKSFGPILGKLGTLLKKYKKHHDSIQVDDKETAIGFLKNESLREGGIYEDNFFTQLIRQLLLQLKATGTKEIVLLIDDLDRIDPDHIFRILNVFSAHYDNPHSSEPNTSNKFGFDKLILVCDIENIRSIYLHKYGPYTNFAGYMEKFYSVEPYNFDVKSLLSQYVRKFIVGLDLPFSEILIQVINDFIKEGYFGIRSLKHFEDVDWRFYALAGGYKFNNQHLMNKRIAYFFIIDIFLNIYDRGSLEFYFREFSLKRSDLQLNEEVINEALKFGFIGINPRLNEVVMDQNILFEYKDFRLQGKVSRLSSGSQNPWGLICMVDLKDQPNSINKFKLKYAEFYQLLLDNLVAYHSMNGLPG